MKKKTRVEYVAISEGDTFESAFIDSRFNTAKSLRRYVKACEKYPAFYEPVVEIVKVTYEPINFKEVPQDEEGVY